jgi:hypothetical protein
MNHLPVASSSLATVAFDADHSVLEVQFRDGRLYRIFDVPAECVQQLLESDSKGAYFNRHIRNRFRYQYVGVSLEKTT